MTPYRDINRAALPAQSRADATGVVWYVMGNSFGVTFSVIPDYMLRQHERGSFIDRVLWPANGVMK